MLFFLSSIAPTGPTNVQSIVVNATAIIIQWAEPDPANGIIRGYSIRYNTLMLNVTANITSVTVAGLLPYTLYVFKVSAFTIEEGPSTRTNATTEEAGGNMYNKANHKHFHI